MRRGWWRNALLWPTVGQAVWLAALVVLRGPPALLFWLVQLAYAVFLRETINCVEQYGLQRRSVDGRREPFGVQHAWNADHAVTNCFIANLQHHSDPHRQVWKPHPTLAALPGPQLPTGYAGRIFLASAPPVWLRVMHRRLSTLHVAA
jgi:alkane 1-monooxygenase